MKKNMQSHISFGLFTLVLGVHTLSLSLYADTNPVSAAAAFNFIDSQVFPIKGSEGTWSDNYIVQNTTFLEVNQQHNFRMLRGYLYSSALAAIVLTHQGLLEDNPQILAKAAGIFKKFNHHQYTTDGKFPHLAGAFPNQLLSEDYHDDPGATTPYLLSEQARIIRHGNNAWYLVALGYYTLRTGDRQFVPALEKLADYFSSDQAQQQQEGAPNFGAIFFGWGSALEPLTAQKRYVATEHQAESFAGLIYAAEVMQSEPQKAYKSQRYLTAAHDIIGFVTHTLYSNNNPHPNPDFVGSFFHTGTDKDGIPVAYSPALDAQTCTFLAFANPLQGIADISTALDYAWQHMYGTHPEIKSSQGVDSTFTHSQTLDPIKGQGALWYQGDKGIWLSGSAQLGLSFKFAHHLQGIAQDLQRAQTIFRDMSKLVWPTDSVTHGDRIIKWPAGSFASFSDNYYATEEPDSVGISEKMPSLEPTAWRYFHLYTINPFSTTLSERLPAPDYVSVTQTDDSGLILSWEAHPLAVAYEIVRSDSSEPIAYVSNLRQSSNLLMLNLDMHPSHPDSSYTVIPRDLSGQPGNSYVVAPSSRYAFSD